MFSEISQIQKDKYHRFPLMWGVSVLTMKDMEVEGGLLGRRVDMQEGRRGQERIMVG
jgi:hypothetical protein